MRENGREWGRRRRKGIKRGKGYNLDELMMVMMRCGSVVRCAMFASLIMLGGSQGLESS